MNSLVDSDGEPTAIGKSLERIDTFFTAIFTVELAINAYAHWFRPFMLDGWNMFDSIVVSLSLVALGPIDMPINVLRSLRAFRVVRLFGRMGALRDIISSLTSAIVPVLNAFLIMLIVSSICELLLVNLSSIAPPPSFPFILLSTPAPSLPPTGYPPNSSEPPASFPFPTAYSSFAALIPPHSFRPAVAFPHSHFS